jgi:hypothetical protein
MRMKEIEMQEAGSPPWARESRGGSRVRASLVELNLRFLTLAATREGRHESAVAGLSREFGGVIAALTPAQRTAAARCPYALFDLRFQDEGFWRSRLADSDAWRVAVESCNDPEISEFVRLALFYGWHLAGTAKLSAKLVLGMHERTAGAFGEITVDRLPGLAVTGAVHLARRWAHCTAFWHALLAAAALDDAPLLHRVQLYGIQLAAAAQLPCRPR